MGSGGGPQGQIQGSINQNQPLAQGAISNVTGQTANQYGNVLGNYNTSVPLGFSGYGGIGSGYGNVLGGYGTFLGGGSPGMTGGYTPGTWWPSTGSGISLQPSLGPATAPMTGSQAGTGSFPTSPGGNPMDASAIQNALTQNYSALGLSPSGPGSGPTDIGYYAQKIAETGGLTPDNMNYWFGAGGRIAKDAGGGGGGGGGGGFGAIPGWQNAAQTGLITPQMEQDMRARAVAPVRAAYQTAQTNVERQRALTGGYSPNYNATQAQLARQMGYGMSDAMTNANAAIAQMRQQGQLAGLQGLTSAQLGALAGQTGALSGLTGLYGTAPGLANMYGQQMLGTNQQALGAASLQNQLMGNIINAQAMAAMAPNGLQSGLGTAGQLAGLAGTGLMLAGMI